MQLQGKVALVTGGAQRLGRAIALFLAEQGCDLMVHFHESTHEAEDTRKQIEGMGVRAVTFQADLSVEGGAAATLEAIDRAFGGLDLLVNSAAILEPVDLLSASYDDWNRTIGLNLQGAFFCLQQAAKRMLPRGGGAVVNISDTAALRPWRSYPLHSISKAGLEMLTKVAALALAPEIRVNSVVPGPILRPPWLSQTRWERVLNGLPQRSAGDPQDVAEAVVHLFENDYITGESICLDGGSLLV